MIRLEHIDKVFNDGASPKAALHDINLEFAAAGLVIIMGPSGCGKTTLLNIISLLDMASSGHYFLNNQDSATLKLSDRERHRRRTFANLFQHYFLLDDFTAMENVKVATDSDSIDLNNLFSKFGLSRIIDQFSQQLSGGEAQRTSLIRALVKNTPVIIADEPTGALDQANSDFLMDALKHEAKTRLVIIVTHNQVLAERYADRVIVMREGSIIDDRMINHTGRLQNEEKEKINYRWEHSLISRRFYKLSRPRLGFAFVSLIIGIVTSLMTFGLHVGGPLLASNHPLRNPDYNVFYLRKQERIPIENTPMNLIRYQRPNLLELTLTGIDLSATYVDVSLRGLLTSSGTFTFNNMALPTMELRPLMVDEYPFPSEDKFNYVYMNKAAYNQLKLVQENDPIDVRLGYATTMMTTYFDQELVTDTFTIDQELTVIDIIDDNSIIPRPMIYYSHFGARRLLESYEVPRLSAYLDYSISWYERIKISPNTDSITNQELLIVFQNQASIKAAYNKMQAIAEYDWESSYNQERLLLTSVMTALDYGLIFFVSIGVLSSSLTLGLSMSRVYIELRRRLAILWELGYSLKVLKVIILSLGHRLAFSAITSSFILTPCLVWLTNHVIERVYGLPSVLVIPWFQYHGMALMIPVTVILIVVLIIEATMRILISRLNTKVLIQELVDDD